MLVSIPTRIFTGSKKIYICKLVFSFKFVIQPIVVQDEFRFLWVIIDLHESYIGYWTAIQEHISVIFDSCDVVCG